MGITVAILVSEKLLNDHKQTQTMVATAAPGAFLPGGTLVNLSTNHDEYQKVIKGKVLLVFVTTDCDACKKELSNVSRAMPSLASKVKVYGVGIEDRDSLMTFIDENQVDVPMLLDHGAVILARLGFRLMPTKVLLHDGLVSRIWYGSSPNTSALIRDVGEAEVK